ncbi:MAG TPA: iron-containing alcohol dehydrogenase [Candidatus Dormibacteraeota bacterium]|nr:iron-containing alcohol dehydrogenase [Candidatus Dormibacteraeota bacterium]
MSGTYKYASPRVIHWGTGSVSKLPSELDGLNVQRFALITTRSLVDSANRLGVEPATRSVVRQHAPHADIDAAANHASDAKVDGIVSYGGGSAIDAAKIVSVRLGALPHIAVPTTLSVAELAAGAGYTNEAGDKSGARDPRQLVSAVIYDASLTLATPIQLWLSTGIRALDHAVEGFLADGEHPFNDVMALEAIRRLFDSLPRAKEVPHDPDVRTENQLAAWFSFTLPEASAAGLSHTMGKQIGARHGIPHGVTSCLLLPHVLRYLATRMPARVAILSEVMGGDAAGCVQDLIRRLGLPQHIATYGIGEAELRRAANDLAGKHSAEDLLQIYLSAL